ncbi:MAG TPA: hypothetical protein VLE73_01815 [Candidatus Saccharimonadales bacterium]|nr:hypothetical protein [Candidatus Saccharimonadales bacterium]
MSTSSEDRPQPAVDSLTIQAIAEAIGDRLGQPSDKPVERRCRSYIAATSAGHAVGLLLGQCPLGYGWRGQTADIRINAARDTVYDLFPPQVVTPEWHMEAYDPLDLANGAYLDLAENQFKGEDLIAADVSKVFGEIYASFGRGLAAARQLGLLGVSQAAGEDLLRMIEQAIPVI